MLNKRLNSFFYACKGVGRLFRTEPNAWIHLLFTIGALAMGAGLGLSTEEWCIIVLCIASVFAAEAFNTAIEDLTDLVSPRPHPLAGHAKDLAAGAVLLTASGAAVAGLIIFLPKIMKVLL